MVYSCGVDNVYKYAVGRELIDADESIMVEMPYLNPDEVDEIAKLDGHVRMTEGYAVDPAFAPKKLQWGDKRRAVPDFVVYATARIVSQRVKDIVEEFEPGAHQFIPIDLYYRGETEPFARYHWLVICKLVDTIDEEKTTYELKMSPWAEGCGSYRGVDGTGRFVRTEKNWVPSFLA